MDPFRSPFSLKTPLFSFPLLFLRYDLCVFQRQPCLMKTAEQRAEVDNYFSKYESVHFLKQSLEEQSCIDTSILPNLILLTSLLVSYTRITGTLILVATWSSQSPSAPLGWPPHPSLPRAFLGLAWKLCVLQNSAVPGDTISGYHEQSFYFSFNVS